MERRVLGIHRRTIRIGAVLVILGCVALLMLTPQTRDARPAWEWAYWVLYFIAGLIVFVALPAALNRRAEVGRAVPWRRLGGFLWSQSPLIAGAFVIVTAGLVVSTTAFEALWQVALLALGIALGVALLTALVGTLARRRQERRRGVHQRPP